MIKKYLTGLLAVSLLAGCTSIKRDYAPEHRNGIDVLLGKNQFIEDYSAAERVEAAFSGNYAYVTKSGGISFYKDGFISRGAATLAESIRFPFRGARNITKNVPVLNHLTSAIDGGVGCLTSSIDGVVIGGNGLIFGEKSMTPYDMDTIPKHYMLTTDPSSRLLRLEELTIGISKLGLLGASAAGGGSSGSSGGSSTVGGGLIGGGTL